MFRRTINHMSNHALTRRLIPIQEPSRLPRVIATKKQITTLRSVAQRCFQRSPSEASCMREDRILEGGGNTWLCCHCARTSQRNNKLKRLRMLLQKLEFFTCEWASPIDHSIKLPKGALHQCATFTSEFFATIFA